MKKLISLFVLVAMSASTMFAAEESNRDENGKIKYGSYNTRTGFFDNFFIEAQGGIIVIGASKMGQGIASDFSCLKPQENFGINLGKWFTPCVGTRIGFQGFKTCWLEPRFWNTQHQSLAYVHGDFMWNLSNTVAGYKSNRVYNCIPYIQAGMIWQNSDHSGHNNHLGLGVGLENDFRVTRWFSITADIRYTGAEASVLGKTYMSYEDKAKIGGYVSAQLGLKFTINGGFERTSTTVKVATSSLRGEINDLKYALDAANAEIEKLRNTKPATDTVVVYKTTVIEKINDLLNAPTMFAQGSDVISPEYHALLAQTARGLDRTKTYIVTGYTSPEGSKELNARLRILRPEAVKRLLVNELGFSPSHIITRAASEEENAQSAIRAAIIREL